MYEKDELEQTFCSYISNLFQKLKKNQGLNQADFGKKVIRFQLDKKGKPVGVKGYVRGSVKNWMEGENYPEYKESVICLALLNLCGSTEADPDLSKKERDERQEYVEKIMWRYLGKKLYSRYPPEAMLILAARGVISLEEIPVLLKETTLESLRIPVDEVKEAGRQRVTDTILEKLCDADSKEELLTIIKENRIYYALGYKTLGIRIRDLWEKKTNIKGLSFTQAVYLLAPRYQNTYRKMMDDILQVSREFIIQFCSQMEFDREMIDEALDTAKMRPLEKDEKLPDYFEDIHRFSFSRRLGSLVQLAIYMEKAVKDRDFLDAVRSLPFYFYLNHYFSLDSAEKQYEEMQDALEQLEVDGFISLIQSGETSWGKGLEGYIQTMNQELTDWKEEEKKAYRSYICSFQKMYEPSYILLKDLPQKLKQEAECLYFFTTMSYAILLGKEYKGELSEQDLLQLKMRIDEEESIPTEDREFIYNFLNSLWVLFLEERPLKEYKGEYIFGIRGTKENPVSVYLNWEDVLTITGEMWKISTYK